MPNHLCKYLIYKGNFSALDPKKAHRPRAHQKRLRPLRAGDKNLAAMGFELPVKKAVTLFIELAGHVVEEQDWLHVPGLA
jgi:hypothetical protein